MTKIYKTETAGYVAAEPGTKILVYVLESLEQFGEYAERYYKRVVVELSCLDCHEYLLGETPSDKSPMLKNEIWQSIVPGGKGVLCRPCMEQRLGRVLTADDFFPPWFKKFKENK